MDFDSVYGVSCSLRLISGREITLETLIQSRTYSHLVMGTPTRKSNMMALQWAMAKVRRDTTARGEPLLIDPERRDYRLEPGDMQDVIDRWKGGDPDRIPEWMPLVECIGVFSSISPARNQAKDASSLTVVWFQDDFGFDEKAIARLREMDWDQHATDWDWDL